MDNKEIIEAEPLITPETEPSVELHTEPEPKARHKKPKLLLFLLSLAVIAIGVGLFFLLRPAKEPNLNADDAEEQQVVKGYQSILDDSSASAEEKFYAQQSLAKFYLSQKSPYKAISILDRIDRDSLSTSELYQLYKSYARAYELANDQVNSSKYIELSWQLSETEEEAE